MVKKIIWMPLIFFSCLDFVEADKRYSKRYIERIKFEPRGLYVKNKNGSLILSKWDSSYVKVIAEKSVKAVDEKEAESLFKKIDVKIEKRKGTLFVETETTLKGNYDVNYKIFLPSVNEVAVDIYNGSVIIKGLKGSFKLKTINGSFNIRNTEGDFRVETINGSFNISDCVIGTLEFKAINGSAKIYVDSLLNPFKISVNITNGNIRAVIPEKENFSIYAHATNGKVNSDFPVYTSEDKIETDSRILLQTVNGSIFVVKK